MYKTKETAIRGLREGEYFQHPQFDLFRDDKGVVLEAVKETGNDLQYASINLQNNKDVVLEAVKGDGRALEDASENIRELCKNKNPIKTLEIEIQKEKLQSTIKQPEQKSQTPPTKRRMI